MNFSEYCDNYFIVFDGLGEDLREAVGYREPIDLDLLVCCLKDKN
jgi:hypothetical protein